MVILQSLALAALLILLGQKWIRRRPAVCYSLATLVSLAVIATVWSGAAAGLPAWTNFIVPIFTQGGLAGALFMAVMFAAAVPNGSKFMRTVMPIRGEVSIIASILTLGHNIVFGRTYFVSLFSGAAMPANLLLAAICSLIMLAIMLPLFVTSFKRVRRLMPPKRWKRLQRLAYGFYALMYVHILLLNLPSARAGSPSARLNAVVYSAIFLSYGCMRAGKALARANRMAALRRALPAAGAAAMVLVCLAAWLPAGATSAQPSGGYADGKYSGAGIGHNGRMTVSVTVEGGRISEVKLTGHVEDEPYITDAADAVIPAVLETQSLDVDACSGATYSSSGLLDAISDALKGAGEGN